MTTTEAYRAWRHGLLTRQEFLDEILVNAQFQYRDLLDRLKDG